jgi:thiol-disulfide isomerase/thioredoxin
MWLLSWIALAWAEPEMIPAELFEAAKRPDAPTSIEFRMADGTTQLLSDHKGRKLVLSFWASWCGPCRKELPALAAWAKEHPKVDVIAVNVDRDRNLADRFLRAVPVDLPIAYDPDANALGGYDVTAMPTMFVFDSKGELVFRKVGFSEAKGLTEIQTAVEAAK